MPTSADSSAVLHLGGALTIDRVTELKALLLAELAERPLQALNLRDISDIDGAGLQLLLSVQNGLPGLRLVEPSPAVQQAFALLRIESLISPSAEEVNGWTCKR